MKSGIKSLKVLFVTHKYPPSIGGMQKQSYELINNYKNIGDCSVIRFNNKYPIWLFFVIIIPWVAIRLIADRKITAIHCNDGLMALFLTPFLLTGKKLYATIHGLDIVYHIAAYQWWVRAFLSRFDGIIAVSEQTKQECLDRGLHDSKVTYIPNAVTPPETAIKDGDFIEQLEKSTGLSMQGKTIITSVGRAIPRKGFSWFVKKVLPQLSDNCIYLIVGPHAKNERFYRLLAKTLSAGLFRKICQMNGIGIDYFELKKILNKPKIQSRVRLLGKISQNDLDQLYLFTDIFVMPNLKVEGDYEGFGLVAQEAVYSGALCIASNIDGIPSAIQHHQTGILLPSGNVKEWINQLNALITDKELQVELANNYKKNMLNKLYDWKDMAVNYNTFFKDKSR